MKNYFFFFFVSNNNQTYVPIDIKCEIQSVSNNIYVCTSMNMINEKKNLTFFATISMHFDIVLFLEIMYNILIYTGIPNNNMVFACTPAVV